MGHQLLYEQIASGADGVAKKGTIVIAPDLAPAARLLTLVHEAAHTKLHFDAERRKETTKTIRETEAEAVAHVVCRALGLETIDHCADYIQLYNGDVDVLARIDGLYPEDSGQHLGRHPRLCDGCRA